MNGSLPETPDLKPAARTPRGSASQTASTGRAWVELLRILADPIRLRILHLLETQAQTGLSVGELADILKLPQSTVSRHLKTLQEGAGGGGGGFIEGRRDGTSMLYRLAAAAHESVLKRLRDMSREYIEHDPATRADEQRLAHVLRQRQDDTERFFGKTAPEWDQIRSVWFGETFHLEGLLALLNPAWVVGDLGAGTGVLLPLIAPHVARVVAVDPSTAMLKGARARVAEQRLENVEILRGTLEALPLADRTLDVAIVALVLHHTVDPSQALAEVRRVLKPGGTLLIIDLQPHAVELFRHKMHHRWMGFGQAQMESWLAAAGFAQVRWHALPSRAGRSKENAVVVPDLFVVRAEAPHNDPHALTNDE
jgi:ArsR family transcriptional regulator